METIDIMSINDLWEYDWSEVMSREMLVVPYKEIWADLYNAEKELLSSIFEEQILDIQHFGSTAIKDMSAKPIIDIMIVVEDLDQIHRFNELMRRKGYSARGENGIEGRRYYIKHDPDHSGNHTHHIHIYQKGNSHISDELLFRDYLRENRRSFKEYEQVKLDASLKYRHSPKDYVDAKNDCVKCIMERARKHYSQSEDIIEGDPLKISKVKSRVVEV